MLGGRKAKQKEPLKHNLFKSNLLRGNKNLLCAKLCDFVSFVAFRC